MILGSVDDCLFLFLSLYLFLFISCAIFVQLNAEGRKLPIPPPHKKTDPKVRFSHLHVKPPSRKAQLQPQRARQLEGDHAQNQQRQHEAGGHLAAGAQQGSGLLFALFLVLLALVVMPFDGVEHAGAQHEQLEGGEDDGDPVHDLGAFLVVDRCRWQCRG